MELLYKLEFNTTNSYYITIIKDTIKDFKINAHCEQYLGYILIRFEEEQTKVDDFFAFVKEKMQSSLFAREWIKIDFHDDKSEALNNFDVKLNLSLFTDEEIVSLEKNNNIDFSNDLNKIKQGGISRFETRNGLKNIFLPSIKHKRDFEVRGHEVRLLITNIYKVSEILELQPKETALLCTIERPLVKVRLRSEANAKELYSSTDFIYAKIADDKESILFSNALKKEGIDYLMCVSDDIHQYSLRVMPFNDQTLIIHGDKGLFPKIDYFTKEKYYSAKNYFDENKGVFNAILQKHEEKGKNFLGVYFSMESKESAFKIKDQNNILDVIKIPNIKNNFLHYLDKVAQTSLESKELIDRYKNEHVSYFEHLEFDNTSNSFTTLLNHIALILGLRNHRDVNDLSLTCKSEKLEYFSIKTLKVNNKVYLDFREVLLDIIKLKILSYNNSDISYIFFKSLAYFINTSIREQKNITSIILCGNLFANKVLLKYTYLYLENDYEIVMPKAYPLDY